jgi:hypothetical protein
MQQCNSSDAKLMTIAELPLRGMSPGRSTWVLSGIFWLLGFCSMTRAEAGWLGVELQEQLLDIVGRQAAALVVTVTPAGG